jgi:hypothetical protein
MTAAVGCLMWHPPQSLLVATVHCVLALSDKPSFRPVSASSYQSTCKCAETGHPSSAARRFNRVKAAKAASTPSWPRDV